MAADAMQFIKATSIDGVSDYFPSAERLVFQVKFSLALNPKEKF